jgi:hypothetical protein
MSQVLFWGSTIFGLISLVGLILSLAITFRKGGELDEPLLQ